MYDTSPPIQHFNYDELSTDCRCFLCTSVRASERKETRARMACSGHAYRCSCDICTRWRNARMEYVANSNRCDLYSELSFLVQGRAWAKEILTWALKRVKDPETADWWWAYHAEKKTLGEWIGEWNAVSGQSGKATSQKLSFQTMSASPLSSGNGEA